MGAPAHVLAHLEGEALGAALDADDDDDTDGVTEIEVLECNWNAVTVFLHCEPQWLGGMSACRMGIAAAEIHAAASLLRLPRQEWPPLLADVQLMGRIAARVQNQQQRKE